ncbi:MAG: DNA mismatch repair endonuclease MutL [Bacilli bacterium]|nr:DNA mismatch repair endonuclease MutL [Bacilli bacterium]
MTVIKQMDEILANKIAAGEVVERCASVVKELVENAIDAKATEIIVEVSNAGTSEIKVTDNGIGMVKDDALMAFNRHATSKLIDEEDLYHINTLGFRGEALASIASVAKVNLKTSQGDVGTIVQIEGGKVIDVSNGDARRGTIITVKDLFYNTPARLKYMKSMYTELASITEYLDKIALSYPGIRITLINDGNTILKTDGSGDLLKTIKEIYGIEVAKKMIHINGSNDDYEIDGYISMPEIHRSNKNNMSTLVNGRVIRNASINRIINDSYSNYKPDTRFPITVININVDPSLVDVNIHPTKMDVKFSKMEELEELLSKIIIDSIKNKTLIPEREVVKVKTQPIYPSLYTKKEQQSLDLEREESIVSEDTEYVINDDLVVDEEITEIEDKLEEEKIPELYPIGLVWGTFIICQNELGMYLIDEHAAKERVNYEIFKEKINHPDHKMTSLLIPITIEYTNNEFIILKEHFDIIRNLGYEIEEFGGNTVIIKATPAWIKTGDEETIIRSIIDILIEEEKHFDIEKFNEHVCATTACKASIRANTNITIEEMEHLISDLRKCKNPFHCPHGRPTIICYTKEDLERQFKRSGF